MDIYSLHAGIAHADITPVIGLNLTGYAVREGLSAEIDEPLALRVLALREGCVTILIVAIDLCLMDVAAADELRQSCARAGGIEPSHVMVNVSHSHSAPGIGKYVELDPPAQQALRGSYWKQVLQAAEGAAARAISSLQPARVSLGWGECRGNINRRQKAVDGSILLGENPDGACDPSVGVLRVDDLNGSPIAMAFRYSCHTVTLGPKTNRISPDFVGPARTLIESALGCPSIFLQGCAGNINPISGIGQDADGSPFVDEDKNRLGQMLGAEVIKVAQTLRSHRRRAAPVLVESVAQYWLFGYEPIHPAEQGLITAEEVLLTLPLTLFPALEEVAHERAEWAAKLQAARDLGGTEWGVAPLVRFDHWAGERLKAARNGSNPATVTFPLQTFTIGGLTILAIPFEVMAETGLALRQALGPDTFVLGFTNGVVSYLPTPQISQEGGMEARLGYKAYLMPAEIPGSWEKTIREHFAPLD